MLRCLRPEVKAADKYESTKRAASTLAACERNLPLAFSFSGGGFLLPYFVGVVEVLKECGVLKPGVSHLAGSSAGSLIAVGVTCNLTNEQLMQSLIGAAKACEKGVRGRLGAALLAQLEDVLPEDAHIRCRGLAHVGITRIGTNPLLKSKVISEFHDRNDLIQALLASCHIPLLSNGNMATKFRNMSVMDGGLTALIPLPPNPLNDHHCVKVSCLSKPIVNQIPLMNRKAVLHGLDDGILPGLFEVWPHTMNATLKYALKPQPQEFLLGLIEAGKRDAQAWFAASGITKASSFGRPMSLIGVDDLPDPQPESVATPSSVASAASTPSGQEAAEVLARSTSMACKAASTPDDGQQQQQQQQQQQAGREGDR